MSTGRSRRTVASAGVTETALPIDHPRPGQAGGGDVAGVLGTCVANHGHASRHDVAHRHGELAVHGHHENRAAAIRGAHAQHPRSVGDPHETSLPAEPRERTEWSVPAGGLSQCRGDGGRVAGQPGGHGHPVTIGGRSGHRADRQDGSRHGRLSAVCRPQTPGSQPPKRSGWHSRDPAPPPCRSSGGPARPGGRRHRPIRGGRLPAGDRSGRAHRGAEAVHPSRPDRRDADRAASSSRGRTSTLPTSSDARARCCSVTTCSAAG